MKELSVKRTIILFLQGTIIGTGAILPGVSGGVLSVAFGIYEMIMELFTNPVKAFKENHNRLVPVCAGVVVGFLLLARAVEWMFAKSAPMAMMLFFGLICGTLPQLIADAHKDDKKPGWAPFVLTMALSFLLFEILGENTAGAMEANFSGFVICGVVCGLSMIVPGLSSSSIMIFMGLYEAVTAGIADLNFSVLIPMTMGMAIAILLFARLVNMLYKKYNSLISKIILGFVVSASLHIVPSEFSGFATFGIELMCFTVGYIIARIMDVVRLKQEN